jgi:tripartite-type tricarboxylate transporter receptor subunit TctC
MFRVTVAIGLLLAVQHAAGQSYPTKPVRTLVTSTAGGPLDVFTRLVTNKMEERLKQPFVVENRGGAGGNLAVTAVLTAPPDGHTVLFSIDTTFTVNPSLFKQIPFDPDKDFIPVSVLAKFGQMLAVHPGVPVNSLKELVALSKERDLNYASAGNALPSHLSFAYLQAVTGLRANHVPFKGNPPALLSLMSGDVHAAMVISTSLLPHAKTGKVKMLAYSDSTRSEVVPGIPTVAEQGYPGFEVVFSYVLLVAAGTPQPIVDTLLAEATRAVMSPDVRDKLRAVDTVPIALKPAESAAWLRANRQKWTDVVQRMNIRVD